MVSLVEIQLKHFSAFEITIRYLLQQITKRKSLSLFDIVIFHDVTKITKGTGMARSITPQNS